MKKASVRGRRRRARADPASSVTDRIRGRCSDALLLRCCPLCACWAAPSPLPLPSVMPKKSKRARSDAELEANREKQRGRDEARRLASLERKKYLAKELLQGVDCSPASPLNDQEKTKSSRGRKRRAVPGTACRSHAPLPRTPCTLVRASFAGVLTCQEIRMCVQEIAGAAAAHPSLHADPGHHGARSGHPGLGTACRSHAPLPRTPCTLVRASFAGVLTCQEIRMCV